jgi:hypothetical protein
MTLQPIPSDMRKISFSFLSVHRPDRRWRMPCLQEAGRRLLAGLTKSNSMIYCLSQINFRIPEAKNAATAPLVVAPPPATVATVMYRPDHVA